jgi:hypothetical protein
MLEQITIRFNLDHDLERCGSTKIALPPEKIMSPQRIDRCRINEVRPCRIMPAFAGPMPTRTLPVFTRKMSANGRVVRFTKIIFHRAGKFFSERILEASEFISARSQHRYACVMLTH